MVKGGAWLCALALAWLIGLGVARAQSDGDDAEARALFAEGVEHTQHERWPDAERAFRASLVRVERPSTLYNLAITLLHRERPSEALLRLDHFERLAEPLKSTREFGSLARLRARATALLSSLVLHVAPADAELWLDDTQHAALGAERSLQLDPGEHVLRFQRPGYESHLLQLTLRAGARAEHSLALNARNVAKLDLTSAAEGAARRLASTPVSAAQRSDRPRDGGTWLSKWWVWTAAALVVGAAVTTGVLVAQRERGVADAPAGTALPEWVVAGTGP